MHILKQMLKLTRPTSIVDWLNLEGESRGFYDLSVTSLEPGDHGTDMHRGRDLSGSRPVLTAPVRRPKLSTVEYIGA